jgi:hypothetical protein
VRPGSSLRSSGQAATHLFSNEKESERSVATVDDSSDAAGYIILFLFYYSQLKDRKTKMASLAEAAKK